LDEYTGECLALKVDHGITSEDVIKTLAELFAIRGVSRDIHSGNGPEFIAQNPDARALAASWRDEYDAQGPHSSLGFRTPTGFAAAGAACVESPCS